MRLSRPSLRLMHYPLPAIFSTKNWFLLTVTALALLVKQWVCTLDLRYGNLRFNRDPDFDVGFCV